MPATLAEVRGWSERNFHLRFILMMLSDCAENVEPQSKLHREKNVPCNVLRR